MRKWRLLFIVPILVANCNNKKTCLNLHTEFIKTEVGVKFKLPELIYNIQKVLHPSDFISPVLYSSEFISPDSLMFGAMEYTDYNVSFDCNPKLKATSDYLNLFKSSVEFNENYNKIEIIEDTTFLSNGRQVGFINILVLNSEYEKVEYCSLFSIINQEHHFIFNFVTKINDSFDTNVAKCIFKNMEILPTSPSKRK